MPKNSSEQEQIASTGLPSLLNFPGSGKEVAEKKEKRETEKYSMPHASEMKPGCCWGERTQPGSQLMQY